MDSDTNTPPRKINNEIVNLQHARLGHLGHQNIKKLSKLSKGIDLIKEIISKEPYTPYAIKKGKNTPYKSQIRPARRECELIYSDIYGPITPRGYKGGRYFITFLDNQIKRSKVEIIEFKSNTFPAFKRYQTRSEHSNTKIRRFRTNYSREYKDYNFNVYRANYRIIQEPT